jgi:CHAT domain-containing protein
VGVDEHLAKWEKEDGPKTLELLVEEALDAIRNTAKESMKDPKERVITENAKKLLSILHSILIEPIQDQLRDRCTNLVISHPHGFISQIPFQALYDETRGEFLIQQKTLCVVPSIRALHRCFQRQAQFEERWEDLKPPFVAGNPDPMGAETPESTVPMAPLEGAAIEAARVAEILGGAELFSGEKMTKPNVVRGLAESRVVLLSTHGVLNSYYPQGALILRGNLDASASSSSGERVEEALTPADIYAMGTIPAGLVVLSGCKSGLGKATKAEGVLGLGQALLQGGAATAVLTLWEVSDSATTDLVTGKCTFRRH